MTCFSFNLIESSIFSEDEWHNWCLCFSEELIMSDVFSDQDWYSGHFSMEYCSSDGWDINDEIHALTLP